MQGHGYLIAHSCTRESEGYLKTAHAQYRPSKANQASLRKVFLFKDDEDFEGTLARKGYVVFKMDADFSQITRRLSYEENN